LTARYLESLEGRHDAELLALLIDDPNFFGANPFVYANKPVSDKSSLLAPGGNGKAAASIKDAGLHRSEGVAKLTIL
jgi:hypothetical protein